MAEQIEFRAARYIRLGPKHAWARVAIDEGTLHLGYGKASHNLALAGDADGLKAQLLSLGQSAQKAAQETRQVIDFYEFGADCLWITLYDEYLWWTFAAPDVTWHGPRANAGDRTRKTIGGWRHTDTKGRPLRLSELSSRLTDVGRYRKSLCAVRERGYLARVINGGVRSPFEDTDEARARHAAFMVRCDNPDGFEILPSRETFQLLPGKTS